MSTPTCGLARINGEALHVPDLRFWAYRDGRRFAICCGDQRGTIELHTVDGWDGVGGVEVHSRRPLFDGDEPGCVPCHLVPGDGPCYSDGSSLAYSEQFLPLIRAEDSAGLLRLLAQWHAAQFPEVAS